MCHFKTTVRQLLTTAFFLITTALNCVGQNNSYGIPEERQHQLDTLISLIKHDRILELSDRIMFPIGRPNPIPDIKNRDEFLLYYPTLFDSAFRDKLVNTKFDSTNTIDHYTGFGLFRGDIWLYDDGRIMTINYSSEEEQELLQKLQLETQHTIHSSIKPWKENILVCETDKFLIRIDLMSNNELRYVSWDKPKTIKDKPDLILFKGVQEFQGTMGGVTYTFKSQEWSYQIDRKQMAETDDQLGLYLRLFKNDNLETSYKCAETK